MMQRLKVSKKTLQRLQRQGRVLADDCPHYMYEPPVPEVFVRIRRRNRNNPTHEVQYAS